jgi:large subunit ribosomal protein L21
MTSAVIKTGGKQYLVQEGEKLRIEQIATEEGKKVTFEEVLLTTSDDEATVGGPFVKGAKVEATVVKHGQAKKIYGTKFKAKKRYMRYFGHRQHFTEVEINKISTK